MGDNRIKNNYSVSNYNKPILLAYNDSGNNVVNNDSLTINNSGNNAIDERAKVIGSKITSINNEINLISSQLNNEGNWITSNYEDSNGYQAVVSANGKVRFYRGNTVEAVKSAISSYLLADFSDVPVDSIKLVKIETVDVSLENKRGYMPYVPESETETDIALSEYCYTNLVKYKTLFDNAELYYGGINKTKKDDLLTAKANYQAVLIAKFEGSKYYEKAKARIAEIDNLLKGLQEEKKPEVVKVREVVVVEKPKVQGNWSIKYIDGYYKVIYTKAFSEYNDASSLKNRVDSCDCMVADNDSAWIPPDNYGGWKVQAGAFLNKDRAERRARELQECLGSSIKTESKVIQKTESLSDKRAKTYQEALSLLKAGRYYEARSKFGTLLHHDASDYDYVKPDKYSYLAARGIGDAHYAEAQYRESSYRDALNSYERAETYLYLNQMKDAIKNWYEEKEALVDKMRQCRQKIYK